MIEEKRKFTRRGFLAAGSVSMASVMATEALSRPGFNVEASAIQSDEPNNLISIGYFNPLPSSDAVLDPLVPDPFSYIELSGQQLERAAVRIKATPHVFDAWNQAVKETPHRGLMAAMPLNRQGNRRIKTARRLDQGDPAFADNGAQVSLVALVTSSKDGWADDDYGSLMIRVGFDKFKKEECGPEIDKLTIGRNFKARKDQPVAAFETTQPIVNRVSVKEGLKLSFDLVDVADKTDRGLVDKMLQAASEISPLQRTGILDQLTLPYITAASTALELIGVNVLNDRTRGNHQIWTFTQTQQLVMGGKLGYPKLLPGYYIVGGFSRRDRSTPIWENYTVAGPLGDEEGGEPIYLYREGENGKTLADFTYILLAIQYGEK